MSDPTSAPWDPSFGMTVAFVWVFTLISCIGFAADGDPGGALVTFLAVSTVLAVMLIGSAVSVSSPRGDDDG